MLRSTLLMLTAGAMFLFAQRPGGPMRDRGMPRYDPATEMTLTGTVEEVKDHAHSGGRQVGIHLSVKSASGVFDVHLGPASFLKKEGAAYTKGDVVEVIGSKVPYEGGEAVIAREIKKGDKTLVLRNKRGIPQWSGGRGRNRS